MTNSMLIFACVFWDKDDVHQPEIGKTNTDESWCCERFGKIVNMLIYRKIRENKDK